MVNHKSLSKDVLRSFSAGGQTPLHMLQCTLVYYVYFLKLIDNTIYTGYTSDLKKRLRYHNQGLVPHTAKFLPVKLISYVAVEMKSVAIRLGAYFKAGTGIAFRNKRLIGFP